MKDQGEECDDGNEENTDSCTDQCKNPSCLDGYVQAGEECDDGVQTAGCNMDCTISKCGDGVLNNLAGETCDDGDVESLDGCDASCGSECLVFVTNGIFDGNFGGLEGADAKCAAAAAGADLYGVYRAWLSDSNSSAATRLMACPDPIVLRDATKVANSWADFIAVDVDHLAPISKDEDNSVPDETMPKSKVWTGGTFNCLDWSSALPANQGTFGSHNAVDVSWMDDGINLCSFKFHLYCVQQPS